MSRDEFNAELALKYHYPELNGGSRSAVIQLKNKVCYKCGRRAHDYTIHKHRQVPICKDCH